MEGQYNLRSPAVKRLMKEAQELREPTEQYHAQPLEDNLFEWHFTIRGPVDSEFDGGLYHGRIILPPEYPMKPPSIILLTPNGRFEIFKKICLSISGHHPESWQPSWSIRTALLAIIGFMPTHGHGAIGSLDYTPEERKVLARKSQEWKCSECGTIRNRLRPVTEASKKTTEEAKELASQIDFQGEKEKKNSAGSASPVKAASPEKPESGSGSGAEGSVPSSPSEAGAAGPASSATPGSTAQPAGTFPMMPPGMFMPPFMNPLLMQNMRQQGAQGAQRMPQFPPNFWPMGSPAGGSGAQGQGQFRFPMMPPGSFPNNTFPSSFSFPSTSATATPPSSSSSTSSNTVSSVSQSPVQSSPAQSSPQSMEAVRDDAGSSSSPAQPSSSTDSQAGSAVTDGLRQRQTEQAAARAAAPVNQTPQPAELPRQHQPQSLSAYLRSENAFVLFFMALLALAIILLVARRLYKLGPDLDFNRI